MSVFKYPDTNSTRAKIDFLNEKFKGLKVAIIGLGGTGSYILDLVSKTCVKEIHLFDADYFQLHNSFRSPGAIEGEYFDKKPELKKVNYYAEIYSRIRHGIVPHDVYITGDNLQVLSDFNWIFISIDKNKARSIITNGLVELKIPFIDVGLGVNKLDDCLVGTLRVTTASELKNDHLKYRIGSEETDENEYSTNIQIAELNCHNATMAVIKWKKMIGFYQDLKHEHNSLYFINTGKILNEDNSA